MTTVRLMVHSDSVVTVSDWASYRSPVAPPTGRLTAERQAYSRRAETRTIRPSYSPCELLKPSYRLLHESDLEFFSLSIAEDGQWQDFTNFVVQLDVHIEPFGGHAQRLAGDGDDDVRLAD